MGDIQKISIDSNGSMVGCGTTIKVGDTDLSDYVTNIKVGEFEPDNINQVEISLIAPLAIELFAKVSAKIVGQNQISDSLGELLWLAYQDEGERRTQMPSDWKKSKAIAIRFLELLIETDLDSLLNKHKGPEMEAHTTLGGGVGYKFATESKTAETQ